MIGRRALLAAAAAAACLASAVPAVAGAAPIRPPENPEGATVTLGATTVAPGAPVPFTGTGFRRADGLGGQIVTVKLDDGAIIGTFTADATGAVAGAVPAPTAAGEHWLRFLAGSGGSSGTSGEPPARSLIGDFSVAAPVAVTPSTSTSTTLTVGALNLTGSGRRATLALDCPAALTAGCRGAVTVTSRAKIGKRKITAAQASYVLTAGQAGELSLRLTRAATTVLDDRGRLAVSVAVRPSGAAAITTNRTLGG